MGIDLNVLGTNLNIDPTYKPSIFPTHTTGTNSPSPPPHLLLCLPRLLRPPFPPPPPASPPSPPPSPSSPNTSAAPPPPASPASSAFKPPTALTSSPSQTLAQTSSPQSSTPTSPPPPLLLPAQPPPLPPSKFCSPPSFSAKIKSSPPSSSSPRVRQRGGESCRSPGARCGGCSIGIGAKKRRNWLGFDRREGREGPVWWWWFTGVEKKGEKWWPGIGVIGAEFAGLRFSMRGELGFSDRPTEESAWWTRLET